MSEPGAHLVLGLDFGGTKLAAGVVEQDIGRVVERAEQATRVSAGAAGSIDDMVALIRRACDAAKVTPAQTAGAGVSFGGPVDASRGVVLLSHHVPGWEGVPLAAVLAERLGIPTAVENDANVQALAEWRFGAGRGARSMLSLNIGTGIGAGVILDGKIYHGAHGMAGELGHTIVMPGGPECTCHKRGCLEAVASGPSIARRAVAALAQSRDRATELTRLLDAHDERMTAAIVFQAAAAGDAVAREVVNETISFLAIGIANAINTLDPEVVAIGGGVARAGEQLFGPLRKAVGTICAPSNPATIRILPSQLGADVGILGGAALVG